MAAGRMMKCFIMLIIFASRWTWHNATDTLKQGDTLNSTGSLVSSSGKFSLNFTLRTIHGSDSNFLSIMRIKREANRAWIANPDLPISSSSSPLLTLDTNNTLKIIHQGGDPFVLSTAPQTNDTSTSVVATLLDSGNFVLQEVSSVNRSTIRVFWQSFDHPLDTFLPGMKLGIDHRNGHIWSLLSRGSRDNPLSPGPFSLDWDPNGHQLKIKKDGVVYWTSGVFSDGRFEFILPDVSKKRYNFSIVSNQNEDYLTYTSKNDPSAPEPEWVLFPEGYLSDYGAHVDNYITEVRYCDGYNIVGGCVKRDRPSDCIELFGDEFEIKKGYFKIINSTSINTSRPASWIGTDDIDCKANCWQDCDCLGFDLSFLNQTKDARCQFWSVDCEFIEELTANTSFVLQPKSPHSPPHKKRFWIGTSIAAALVVMLFCIFCYRLRRTKLILSAGKCFEHNINGAKIQNELLDFMKSKRPTHHVNGLQNDDGNIRPHDLIVFSYVSVLAATRNFSEENKLGQGGFGPVYKGKLVTGREIAVKRLSKCSAQGALEFKNELILIYELQHTNLVQLFGFCIHGEERMLIYEYMSNKSLDYFLFDSSRGGLLDWKKRFSIIEGITQGLLYLHKYSRTRIIHRDLKASNILLDESMNPKISDFGMARIFTHNEEEANTNRVMGTYGYMSPEYAMKGIFSIKSDVYSFGVLMLEIISGRRNNSFYNDDRMLNIVGYTWKLWKEGAGLQLMDPTLGDSCNGDQLLRCIHVGLLCVEEHPADRPTMQDVVSMLTNENMSLPVPTKPAFCTERNVVTSGIAGKGPELISINGLSISDLDGR
ncbi:PREDICTED: G-type lectin S-receptor-like serine/threonine-protein kinase At1g67520 [Prunus mume]|uniref:Receptor-like serine/threonine-protein kinase n=1 Tax=Prunus mume TaxID=102107 RepID=A0ABM1LLD4_PRUMU|nr:PREDICTED: G-type lectin S-receptor-like serine/threonine-protein kinase At1g67520 [Prunus mume]